MEEDLEQVDLEKKTKVSDKTKFNIKQKPDYLPNGTSLTMGGPNEPGPPKKRFLRSVVERFLRPYE
jgi:hypothetical protein